MAITWRNVGNGGGAAASTGLFEVARRNIDSGFGALQDTLKTVQDTDLKNWDQIKENNTNTALDKLYQYASPEAYAAAQASGQLAVDPAYGAQVDARAVRNAAEARLGILQNAAMDTQKYKDVQTEVAARPLLDQYYALKTPEERAAFRAANDLGLNEGQLADAEQTQQLALNRDARDERTTNSSLASDALNRTLTTKQLNNLKKDEELDAEIGQFSIAAQELQAKQDSQIAEVALRNGFKVNPTTGRVDYSSDGNAIALKAELSKLGLDKDLVSQARTDFLKTLTGKYGSTRTTAAAKLLPGTTNPYDNLTSDQRAVVDTKVASIGRNIQDQEANLNEDIRKNPLAKVIIDYVGDATTLYSKINDVATDPGEKEALGDGVQRLIDLGVPPAIIDMGLAKISSVEENTWIFNNKAAALKSYIDTVMQDPNYSNQVLRSIELRDKKDALNKLKIQQPEAEDAMQRRTLSDLGQPVGTVNNNLNIINDRYRDQVEGK